MTPLPEVRPRAFVALLLVATMIATSTLSVRADEDREEPIADEQEVIACPQDAIECWDGSVLRRASEYDCEFYPYECPGECWFQFRLSDYCERHFNTEHA